jgi:sodium transport system permease protein
MKQIFAIFLKEMNDAMRDRRTLTVVLITSLFMVPFYLFLFSQIATQVEAQKENRQVIAVNMKDAPSLENYILRQGYEVKEASADYEEKSRNKELSLPVLIVPKGMEDELAQAKRVKLEIAYDTTNRQAEMGYEPLSRLLNGFEQERAQLDLQMRGISPELLNLVQVKAKHLNLVQERKNLIASMLPMVLIMAIVMGGMFAAIDTTAGERERGSLEPLMMNPVSGWQLAIGKSSAVTMVSVLITVLTIVSFFPAQSLIRSESLKAQFQFGVPDAVSFLLLLIPIAVMLSALQVAVALTCKTFKEAQVRTQIISLVVTMAPVFMMVNPGKEPAWIQWVPILSQSQMMNQVLRGEAVNIVNLCLAGATCALIALLSTGFTATQMRKIVVA